MKPCPDEYKDHPHQKYPWRLWFDGKERTLVRGVDFEVSAQSFRSHAFGKAASHRKDLTATVDGDTVTIQATPWKT